MSALPLLTALALARACAPAVSPQTLLAVAQTESGLDPLSIGVNGRPRTSVHPASRAEAVRRARALLAEGQDIDLGFAQINVRNLAGLQLSLDQAFDPCLNLKGAAAVLARSFLRERRRRGDRQAALVSALSAYNTGDAVRGVRNGYVAQVRRAAGRIGPALSLADPQAEPAVRHPRDAGEAPVRLARAEGPVTPSPACLDVFARPAGAALVEWRAPSTPSRSRPTSGDPS